MTNIRILSNSGRLCGYEVTGHTGYAPQGKDILCAALSMLSITCANAIEKIAGVKPQVYTDEDSGTLLLRLRPTQLSATTDTILNVFKLGAEQLQEDYPEHIQIYETEEFQC